MSNIFNKKNILALIITAAFLVRIIGINYGLPLWLISDEPPFTAASLKMLELKTLLPVFHEEEFKKIIYFPPYLSYLYLLPFSVVLGISYVFAGLPLHEFKNLVISDPSSLFILARFLNVILGTMTVWLVFRFSHKFFKNGLSARASAFFLAFSLLHINLSSVGRDWVPAVFMFSLSLFFLTNDNYSFKKRFLAGGIISGLSFGISLISGFAMVFMLLWYLIYEKHTIIQALREKVLYLTLAVFLFLAGISIAVFPFGFVFAKYTSAREPKHVLDLLSLIINFFIPILKSEPVLIFFSGIGLMFSYQKQRRYFWVVISFFLSYEIIFYYTYHYQARFTIYLFPILAGLAGYGLMSLISGKKKVVTFTLLIVAAAIPILSTIGLLRLDLKNDSRTVARKWAEKNLPENSKIIVEARLMRLSSNTQTIEEQARIDPNSLRQIDRAEASFIKNPHGYKNFHALNLYTVKNQNFFTNISSYARRGGYEYLIIDPFFETPELDTKKGLALLKEKGELVKAYGENQKNYSIDSGEFGFPWGLFAVENPGPLIEIYRLGNE
jgi:hypothetical protein